jgi:hypothetical protein
MQNFQPYEVDTLTNHLEARKHFGASPHRFRVFVGHEVRKAKNEGVHKSR